ncbi:hypothetical protein [Burkholderia diffusa]|uniref:hypothetical protein n=1 Tax=Burkholderia diffusa TaxID=488732 RepID=UPI001E2D2F9F|nr:hypothetical protein [Burkholderia diffusa]
MIDLTRWDRPWLSLSMHGCFSARMRRHMLGRNLFRDIPPTMHAGFCHSREFACVHLDGQRARQRQASIEHPRMPQGDHDGRMDGKYRQRDGSQRLACARGLPHLDRRRVRAAGRDAVCERDYAAARTLASGIG